MNSFGHVTVGLDPKPISVRGSKGFGGAVLAGVKGCKGTTVSFHLAIRLRHTPPRNYKSPRLMSGKERQKHCPSKGRNLSPWKRFTTCQITLPKRLDLRE